MGGGTREKLIIYWCPVKPSIYLKGGCRIKREDFFNQLFFTRIKKSCKRKCVLSANNFSSKKWNPSAKMPKLARCARSDRRHFLTQPHSYFLLRTMKNCKAAFQVTQPILDSFEIMIQGNMLLQKTVRWAAAMERWFGVNDAKTLEQRAKVLAF